MGRYNTVTSVATATGAATLSSPNQGLFTTLSGSAPYTVTLTDPSLAAGQSQGFWNNTGGVVTLSTPTGTIYGPNVNSATTYVMSNNSVVFVTCDGTNYIVTGTVGSGFINVDVSSSTYTAKASQFLWVNTTSTAITVTLPAAPAKGDIIRIVDIANNFNVNNLTIARNSLPIMGDNTQNLTVATQGAAFDLIYYDATRGWRIFTI